MGRIVEMTDEKPPFIKCFIHESKKAYRVWATIILTAAAVIAVCYAIYLSLDIIQNTLNTIYSGINSVLGILYSGAIAIPWWIYVVSAAITIPSIYAAAKCIGIRYNIRLTKIKIFHLSLFTGLFVCTVGVLIDNIIIFLFGGALIIFSVVIAMADDMSN